MTDTRLSRSLSVEIPEPNITRFLFADTRLAPLWTIIRLYVGYEWLNAGWGKLTNPSGVWVGEKAGTAVSGFLQGALTKTSGDHPDVQGYSAWFLQNVTLPNATLFSYVVTFGEIVVRIGLLLGLFTGFAAIFGGFMNAPNRDRSGLTAEISPAFWVGGKGFFDLARGMAIDRVRLSHPHPLVACITTAKPPGCSALLPRVQAIHLAWSK